MTISDYALLLDDVRYLRRLFHGADVHRYSEEFIRIRDGWKRMFQSSREFHMYWQKANAEVMQEERG